MIGGGAMTGSILLRFRSANRFMAGPVGLGHGPDRSPPSPRLQPGGRTPAQVRRVHAERQHVARLPAPLRRFHLHLGQFLQPRHLQAVFVPALQPQLLFPAKTDPPSMSPSQQILLTIIQRLAKFVGTGKLQILLV